MLLYLKLGIKAAVVEGVIKISAVLRNPRGSSATLAINMVFICSNKNSSEFKIVRNLERKFYARKCALDLPSEFCNPKETQEFQCLFKRKITISV